MPGKVTSLMRMPLGVASGRVVGWISRDTGLDLQTKRNFLEEFERRRSIKRDGQLERSLPIGVRFDLESETGRFRGCEKGVLPFRLNCGVDADERHDHPRR